MSVEAKKSTKERISKKEKKEKKEILKKIERANELCKIVDDFNQDSCHDCNEFIKYDETQRMINDESKKKIKKESKKDQRKDDFQMNKIKEKEDFPIIKEKSKKKKSTWRLITMITLNGIFFFVELITGISTHSLALQTDAFNMLSDEASVIIGLVVHRFSKKNSTPRMTFGYIRAETIGGLCNSVFMYAVALTIFLNAIELFVDPHEIEHSLIFLIVGILGLLINLIGIIVFNTKDNDNIKGVFLHALGDFLGSIGVLISALVQNFCHSKILKNYVDPVISIIIAIFLTFGTTGLFKKTIKIVAETVPDDLDAEKMRKNILKKVTNIIDIHDFHVWQLVDDVNIAIMHVVINSIENRRKVTNDITNYLIAYGVYSTTIQVECKNDIATEFAEKKNHCAFASQYNYKLRAFHSKPSYLHLIGCEHMATLYEDSYEDSYEVSNSEHANTDENFIANANESTSSLKNSQFDQYDDETNRRNLESEEHIEI